jgi:hypothetical protein
MNRGLAVVHVAGWVLKYHMIPCNPLPATSVIVL